MEARVHPDYPVSLVRAFAGHEFIRQEWRKIPDNAKQPEIKSLEDAGLLIFRKPENEDLESLRQLARLAGIPFYWSKKAETLRLELDSIDEEE